MSIKLSPEVGNKEYIFLCVLVAIAWGYVAAARKRSHQWCLILTTDNTKKEWHVIVSCNQLGETLRAASTLLIGMSGFEVIEEEPLKSFPPPPTRSQDAKKKPGLNRVKAKEDKKGSESLEKDKL